MIIRTAGVVVFEDDKVLLVRHREGVGHPTGPYSIPAGKIRQNESISRAAIREVSEKTGLRVQEKDLIPLGRIYGAKIKRQDGVSRKVSLEAFVCEKYKGVPRGSDETMSEWIKVSELKQHKLLPNTEKIIQKSIFKTPGRLVP